MNKRKRFFGLMAVLMLALVSVGFVSCGDDDDKEIVDRGSPFREPIRLVGTWTYSTEDEAYSLSETYTLNADSTFTLVWQEDDKNGKESGTWRYEGDGMLTLTTIVGEKPGTHTYRIGYNGNVLYLRESDGDIRGPYMRKL